VGKLVQWCQLKEASMSRFLNRFLYFLYQLSFPVPFPELYRLAGLRERPVERIGKRAVAFAHSRNGIVGDTQQAAHLLNENFPEVLEPWLIHRKIISLMANTVKRGPGLCPVIDQTQSHIEYPGRELNPADYAVVISLLL
jgi:hypothetical protein